MEKYSFSDYVLKWGDGDMMDVIGIRINNSDNIMSCHDEHNTATEEECIQIIITHPRYEKFVPTKFKTPEFALAAKLS